MAVVAPFAPGAVSASATATAAAAAAAASPRPPPSSPCKQRACSTESLRDASRNDEDVRALRTRMPAGLRRVHSAAAVAGAVGASATRGCGNDQPLTVASETLLDPSLQAVVVVVVAVVMVVVIVAAAVLRRLGKDHRATTQCVRDSSGQCREFGVWNRYKVEGS